MLNILKIILIIYILLPNLVLVSFAGQVWPHAWATSGKTQELFNVVMYLHV